MSHQQGRDELLKELTEKAKALWGDARAAELSRTLETTASQLIEVRQHLPERDVEPGFFQ